MAINEVIKPKNVAILSGAVLNPINPSRAYFVSLENDQEVFFEFES